MELIDRDAYKQELEQAIDRNLRMTGRPHPVVLTALQYAIAKLDSAPVVDAVPIEFIKKKIDKYREIEDQAKDDPLSEYFELERYSLEWLLVDWKAEQRKQNDNN